MKFRILNDEELAHFENDLKAFLIIHGVDGDSWVTLNKTAPEKARALVELFSDQVLQIVYEKIQCVEHRSPKSLLVFHCGKDQQALIAIQSNSPEIDLSTPESIHTALTENFGALTIFRSQKTYTESREEAVHQLLEQGAVPSSLSFWNALNEVLENN